MPSGTPNNPPAKWACAMCGADFYVRKSIPWYHDGHKYCGPCHHAYAEYHKVRDWVRAKKLPTLKAMALLDQHFRFPPLTEPLPVRGED